MKMSSFNNSATEEGLPLVSSPRSQDMKSLTGFTMCSRQDAVWGHGPGENGRLIVGVKNYLRGETLVEL